MAKQKPIRSPTARGLDPLALQYSASIEYDTALYPFDIAASIAHARMLGRQNIISSEDAKTIERGLTEIEREIESGEFTWREEFEDIHLNIECACAKRSARLRASPYRAFPQRPGRHRHAVVCVERVAR
jgi:argininosuccinate lyase